MRAINHAITGAVIGLSISSPVVALPVALFSHFLLDAVPHHGNPKDSFTSFKFKFWLVLDAALCFLLVVYLRLGVPADWLQASFCAFLAASPDFMSIGRFLRAQEGKDTQPKLWITKFASKIQWCERPWGWTVEVVYFGFILFVLLRMTI